jgi:hypothetical protein
MHVISRFEGQPFYNEEQKDNAKEKAEFLKQKLTRLLLFMVSKANGSYFIITLIAQKSFVS